MQILQPLWAQTARVADPLTTMQKQRLPLFAVALQVIREFARVPFGFLENAEKNFPCNEIFIADLSNQRAIGLDLAPFE